MNLSKKRKPYWREDPYHTWYELNLEDEILVRGVECNIPEIWMFYHVWIFAKKLKLFVWTCVLPKFYPKLLALFSNSK
jgi:hypothetical protein